MSSSLLKITIQYCVEVSTVFDTAEASLIDVMWLRASVALRPPCDKLVLYDNVDLREACKARFHSGAILEIFNIT